MRGLAALLAAAAVWMVVTRRAPHLRFRPRRGVPVDPALFTTSAAAAAAGGVLAVGVTGVPAAALALAALAGFVPAAVRSTRWRAQRERLADAWPDVLALVRSRIAAGAPLPEALVAALRRSSALAAEAAEVEREISFGRGFEPALDDLRSRLDDPMADRVLVTLAAAHRAGGGRVGAILSALATSVGDELRLRKAHHAAMTEQRLTALVALLAPWGLLMLTLATNPQSGTAFRSSQGALIIVIGLVATATGYLAARRTAQLGAPPRVFE